MKLHVFVAMPFGIKNDIDFDRVFAELIEPGLSAAGYQVMRADQELSAGSIRTDMFQELLLADLVVADLTLDNPNVWYELGVRHALRARGVIQIASSARERMPFDVYTDRTLRYHLKNGAPDPDSLAKDRKALGDMAQATMARWHGYKISPVYHLLPDCPNPTGGACWSKAATSSMNPCSSGVGVSKWRVSKTVPAIFGCWQTRRRRGRCTWKPIVWRARR